MTFLFDECLFGAGSIQKLRASRSKDEAEQMRCQLEERDSVISEQRQELDALRTQCGELDRDRNQTDAEISALRMSVARHFSTVIGHSGLNIHST